MLLVSSSRVSSSYVQAVKVVALERQWDTQCNRCESTVWPIILWSCSHPASLCSSSSVCTYLALQQLWRVCFGVTAWILWGFQSGENLVRLMTTPCCADIQWDILSMQPRKQWCLSGMTVNTVLNSLFACISLSRLVICATFLDHPEVFDFSMYYLLHIDTQLHMFPPKWLWWSFTPAGSLRFKLKFCSSINSITNRPPSQIKRKDKGEKQLLQAFLKSHRWRPERINYYEL